MSERTGLANQIKKITDLCAAVADGYDMIVSVNTTNGTCEVYYLNQNLWSVFESTKLKFNDIIFKLSQKVVEENQEDFLKTMRIPLIREEIAKTGSFVRTIYVDVQSGRRAKNIRVREVPGYPDWLLFVFFDITTTLDHDVMTDEYTRTGFLDRAQLFVSELSRTGKYSLVYTNVKGFKAVNELFGDKCGDMVILQTRDVLK